MADVFRVENAGSTEVNGDYVEDGTLNGQPLYRLNGAITMQWRNYFGVYTWVIMVNSLAYYYRDNSYSGPPDVGIWGYTEDASKPVPTVTKVGGGEEPASTGNMFLLF